MPRPMKRRRVCALPVYPRFGPAGGSGEPGITLAIDEYEAIRLIDLMAFSQEECARQMGVGRTTVQTIYQSARLKISRALVEGRALTIEGGEYSLCPDACKACGGGCGRRRRGAEPAER